MADDDWDANDFEPQAPTAQISDKWEGEDEEDVKDAWDADDAEKPKEDAGEPAEGVIKAVQRKKKKPLAKLAEKEARLAAEKENSKELTKEEKQAEAERLRKIQEESDMKLAKEAFGLDATGVDGMFPVTEEEFVKFKEAVVHKVSSFSKSKHYPVFLDKLIQDLIIDMETEDVKKISSTISSLYHEKQRLQKEQEKKSKKKKKVVLKAERDDNFGDLAAATGGNYSDFDDDFI